MTPDIGLRNDELCAVADVFGGMSQVRRAVAFGSRAKGTHKPYSDVDVALYGDLDMIDVERVACDLEELPLAYKFDVTAYGQITNPMLKRHIDRVGVVIYERRESVV